MRQHRPETLTLAIALAASLAVLGAFLINLVVSRQTDLDDGQMRLRHFGQMVAEHTARSLEAVDILLRDMATDLSTNHSPWHQWEASRGWEYVSQRHSRSLPQLRDLIVFDDQGDQRFISTYFPTPRINVRDRPYFMALEKGAETATFGPYVGRNSGRYTYGLARRLQNGLGVFAGAAFAAIEIGYFPDFCWSNRLSDDFEAVLINGRGQITASCRPADMSRTGTIIGAPAGEVLMGGKLKDKLPEAGDGSIDGILVSVTRIAGYPDLRILAAIPEETVLRTWRRRALEFGILAILVVLALVTGSWLARRQIRELSQAKTAIEEHRQQLENRVQAATAELARQKEEAERASTAKSRFLAAASHDLRQPLHALSLFAADLQRQVRSGHTTDLPRLSEQITASTGLLGELLDSLLDVSRLDVAGVKADIRPFALATVFDRLAASYRRAAQNKKLRLHFRASNIYAASDSTLLERLLANLLSNAIRYTPEGGRILVAARRAGDNQVRVEVRDSGIGIPPEHQAAIFAEFYQVGNLAREQNKGLGLGLSIVERLASALKIPIALRSAPGNGTTFAVTLPRCPAPPQPKAALPAAAASTIVFCGVSEDLVTAASLAQGWGLRTQTLAPGTSPVALGTCVVVTDAEGAAELSGTLAPGCRLVVITSGAETAPAGAFGLRAPLRPAKLRALLEQLQKTDSKSSP